MTPSNNLDPEGNPIHYTHPWEETTPGTDADEPSSTPSPQVPRLIPIHPEPVSADDLRHEYAATLNLHKPDPDIPSAYPPEHLQPPVKAMPNLGDGLSREADQGRRRRGGQPGNLNALKHGLYIDGRSVRNTTPIERAQLFDINDIIENCKDYMRYTYEHGIRLNDMLEINETMRSLSLAAIGLTRLINTHAEYISTPYSSDFQVKKRSTIIDLVEHYKKKLSPYMDLSDVITDPNAEK